MMLGEIEIVVEVSVVETMKVKVREKYACSKMREEYRELSLSQV